MFAAAHWITCWFLLTPTVHSRKGSAHFGLVVNPPSAWGTAQPIRTSPQKQFFRGKKRISAVRAAAVMVSSSGEVA
jgi:hypothetical protein